MTARLSLLITADGRQALAEGQRVQQSFKATASAGFTIGEAARVSGAELGEMTSKVSLATLQMSEFRDAQLRAALGARSFGAANQLAAGSLGNLTAQFNDIGVMLAAGQNPLQLALQQGTQITQVIGPLGATGAVRALGTAFVGLFSPVNLATIGIIAGGAALFQWAQSARAAKDDTGDLEEALGALADRTTEAQQKLALLNSGAGSIEELRVLNEIADLEAQREEFLRRSANLQGRGAQASRQVLEGYREEIELLDDQIRAEKEALEAVRERERVAGRIQAGYRTFYETQQRGEQQARDALAQQYQLYADTRVEASALSQQLLEAYRAGTDFASIDMPVGVDAAAAAAAALAQDLGVSLQVAQGMVALGNDLAAPGGSDQARDNVRNGTGFQPGNIVSQFTLNRRRSGSAGSRAQTDQVQELIRSLQQELDVLKETDPVQKEIIRNRDALAEATEAEREKIEGLLTQHEAETQALERKRSAWSLVGTSASRVLDVIFDKSKNLNDMVRNLGITILDTAIQGNLLGTGPFGNGAGGLVGSLFPGLIPGRANGGMIYGPGGGRDDRVPIMASNGEFVVNAAATAQNRNLLEMINSGGAPGFAAGGMVGQSRAQTPANANATPRPLAVSMDVSGARGDREIEEAGYRGMQRALQEYDREVLPERVGQIRSNERVRG
ncbi:phage tail length tape measure family protein [Roseobacter sp. S98]|uniref:phage tail length tape measure family protein n=1 Tax=Roseobacter algicola (ex Choi et al. 2025) (nom. illeg.) TaxID=3092138 RepID=UPI003F519089